MRIVLHEFGLTWQDAEPVDRPALVTDEPQPFDRRWDAFLAAYAEHLTWHERLEHPPWTRGPGRFLATFWFAGGADLATLRIEALVHAPAAFQAHGVLVARRDLVVV